MIDNATLAAMSDIEAKCRLVIALRELDVERLVSEHFQESVDLLLGIIEDLHELIEEVMP